ncbi:ATP binding domain 4 [Entomortierella beljakovae]|nr:ATP binding domain 4 [Entomortierella beljakovae]
MSTQLFSGSETATRYLPPNLDSQAPSQSLSPPPSRPLSPASSTISEVTMSCADSESESEMDDRDTKAVEVTYMRPGWLEDHIAKAKAAAAIKTDNQDMSVSHGGKDSFYNLMQCVANGHQVIALGNLRPPIQDNKDELDSYMYQTVGHDVIHLYEECLDLPLYRREINGRPIEQGSDYVTTSMDETEDLFELLQTVKAAHPDLEAVSVGAILSNYQRIRVENVCGRLGLMTLAYLWQRDQEELLNEMAQSGVNAILIKIAAIGLKTQHLGQSIGDMYPHLCRMNQQYDLHICGEGGEYETVTLDCPLFKRRIIVDESEIVIHSDDHFAQVAYLRFKKLHLEEKSDDELDPNWKSDMNLSPFWKADSVLDAIGNIVCANLSTDDNDGKSAHNELATQKSEKTVHDCTHIDYQHKFRAHQSDIVCAIGGTTAFESLAVGSKSHLSITEETTTCLQNVQAKLESINLSWQEVVFMQVFVSNMGDFGVVNGAYKNFFSINPPPRACVGANLPNEVRIQVSCIAIRKTITSPKPRSTLHVQGISYWAPANIGPYSQATQQAYHGYIAGQIGMIPCTLDLPEPASLAKETAWSLRNLLQIATVCQMDIVHRSAMCVVYVNDPKSFAAVLASWDYIATKDNHAPILAVCVPSLPKGSQVEWQTTLHDGKVYADKLQENDQDGYETDDDDVYQLENRALQPTTLSLIDKYPTSDPSESQWEARTQSWFLCPMLTALSVIYPHKDSALSSLLSSLSLSEGGKVGPIPKGVSLNMLALMTNAMDRILESYVTPAAGPGVKHKWGNVVGVTLYYHEALIKEPNILAENLENLLIKLVAPDLQAHESHTRDNNIAVTLVPVLSIADSGVLALTLSAVGTMPTIPGLLLAQ